MNQCTISGWGNSGTKTELQYDSSDGKFTIVRGDNTLKEMSVPDEYKNTMRFFVSLDYTNEWIRIEDYVAVCHTQTTYLYLYCSMPYSID